MDSIKCDNLDKAQAFYNYNVWSKYGSPKGVTIEAVRELERKMEVVFPRAFVEYLQWMGQENPIFIGSDAYFEHIFSNSLILDEIFEDNDIDYQHTLKPVVSLTHQGYIASWFYCEAGVEDPICYGYSESDDDYPTCKNKKFSDMLYDDMIEFVKDMRA